MDDDIILDSFSLEMESLAMDMEELQESIEVDNNGQELNEDEVSLKEFFLMALNSSNESSESYTEVVVNNFDSFDTPLNNCSAFTISCLLIFFFLALATIGGVLNE